MFGRKSREMPGAGEALAGRSTAVDVPAAHFINGNPLVGPFPADTEVAVFGMGCFWGAERRFWKMPGVFTTSAGYAGGATPNPSYEEVCSGMTGHTEVVLVVYDPAVVALEKPIAASRGSTTLAVRVPAIRWLRELLDLTGPLVSTSANRSGEPPLTSVEQLSSDLQDVLDAVVDAGPLEGKPSTIVDFTGDEPRLIREGDRLFTQKVWKTLRKSL